MQTFLYRKVIILRDKSPEGLCHTRSQDVTPNVNLPGGQHFVPRGSERLEFKHLDYKNAFNSAPEFFKELNSYFKIIVCLFVLDNIYLNLAIYRQSRCLSGSKEGPESAQQKLQFPFLHFAFPFSLLCDSVFPWFLCGCEGSQIPAVRKTLEANLLVPLQICCFPSSLTVDTSSLPTTCLPHTFPIFCIGKSQNHFSKPTNSPLILYNVLEIIQHGLLHSSRPSCVFLGVPWIYNRQSDFAGHSAKTPAHWIQYSHPGPFLSGAMALTNP